MQEGTTQETTFEAHVREWERLLGEHGKTSNEAGEYYDKHILPNVEQIFVESSKHLLKQKQYDGLILTVGRSPEPQILTLCAIAGESSTQVGLLYRQAAGDSLNRICKRMEWTPHDSNSRARIISGSDTIEIYKEIMNFYTKWGKPKKIAIGITGGNKVMSSAAAMAGAILGADLYYVDTKAKNKFNKPVPGNEYLRLVDNPYAVFGDFEADKAKALFGRHDYAGAQRISRELTQQIRDLSKLMTYRAYGYLCEAYDAWDNFNVQRAARGLSELLDILDQFGRSTELGDLYKFKSRLDDQKKALDCLSSFVNNKSKEAGLPCDVSDRFHFAFTVYHNALRRSAQGKYDLACLLLYRLLEWIGQCRLDKYKIDTEANTHNYSAAGASCTPQKSQKQILERYIDQSKRFGQPDGPTITSLPAKEITLVDMYLLLHALEDPLVQEWDWQKFNNEIETRNKSVYIHGRRVVNNREFQEFHKTTKLIFKKAQKLESIEASDFTERHEFIVL